MVGFVQPHTVRPGFTCSGVHFGSEIRAVAYILFVQPHTFSIRNSCSGVHSIRAVAYISPRIRRPRRDESRRLPHLRPATPATTDGPGDKIDTIVYEASHYDPVTHRRVPQRVTLTTSSRFGLPTPADENVILGLLCLAKH